jgi:hypothetical protein
LFPWYECLDGFVSLKVIAQKEQQIFEMIETSRSERIPLLLGGVLANLACQATAAEMIIEDASKIKSLLRRAVRTKDPLAFKITRNLMAFTGARYAFLVIFFFVLYW